MMLYICREQQNNHIMKMTFNIYNLDGPKTELIHVRSISRISSTVAIDYLHRTLSKGRNLLIEQQ